MRRSESAWPACLTAVLVLLFHASVLHGGDWWAPGVSWGEGESPFFPVDTRLVIAGGQGTVAESPPFMLDTRSRNAAGMGEASFVLDTRGGIGMGASDVSPVFAVDTRSVRLVAIAISGPGTVAGGSSAAYTCMATDAAGGQSDVSGMCMWSLSGMVPDGVTMVGRTLQAGATVGTHSLAVQASLRTTDGQLIAVPLPVTVAAGGLVATIRRARVMVTGAGTWELSAEVVAYGSYGIAQVQWSVDGVPLQGVSSLTLTRFPLTGVAGTRRLSVALIDTHAQTAAAEVLVTLNKAPSPREPWLQSPVADPVGGDILDYDGNQFQFVSSYIPNGLIVVTHGLWSSAESKWPGELALSATVRLIDEGKPRPNVCVLDWHQLADPSGISDFNSLFKPGFVNSLVGRGVLLLPDTVLGLEGLLAIHPFAVAEGKRLADWVRTEVQAGHIDAGAPIHLIGHSAGGWVMGECALQLVQQGVAVGPVQVTTLDTPYFFKPDAKPIQASLDAPASVRYERFRAALGSLAPGLAGLGAGSGYYDHTLQPPLTVSLFGPMHVHSWVHDWYRDETVNYYGAKEQDGFYYSPFMGNGFHGMSLGPALRAGPRRFAARGAADQPMSGWDTFGTVTTTGSVYSIAEDANAGLSAEVNWPVGAASVGFSYRFAAAGDGDYLVVYGGTNGLPLFIGPDLLLSRDGFVACEAPVSMLAGTTSLLTFMLVSRGATNAVLELKDIVLSVTDDPDGDGLATSQEQTLGTDPLSSDTDGDGLGDFDELNTYFTDPTRSDTDGDGQTDGQEVLAGANPGDPNSTFMVVAVDVVPGGVAISWQGAAGKTYRINRCSGLSSGAYDTIATGIQGASPLTTSIDTDGTPQAFYWVELEP